MCLVGCRVQLAVLSTDYVQYIPSLLWLHTQKLNGCFVYIIQVMKSSPTHTLATMMSHTHTHMHTHTQ